MTDESGQTAGFAVGEPITLDYVAKRMDEICNAHVAALIRIKTDFEATIDELAASVEASLEIDQKAVASIVVTRVAQMARDAAAAGLG